MYRKRHNCFENSPFSSFDFPIVQMHFKAQIQDLLKKGIIWILILKSRTAR